MRADNPALRLNVLLTEGRKLLREGLCALLERHEDINVVAEADDSLSAAKVIGAMGIDVVVFNVVPPEYGGTDVIRSITRSFPHVRVVVLTIEPTATVPRALLNAGAHGCLTKESSATELVEAIRTVASGKTYLSPRLLDVMVNGYARPARQSPSSAAPTTRPLARREREILQRIAGGETTKEIARALGVGTKTVETHRRRMMQKLNKHSVAELTKYAIVEGLSPLDATT